MFVSDFRSERYIYKIFDTFKSLYKKISVAYFHLKAILYFWSQFTNILRCFYLPENIFDCILLNGRQDDIYFLILILGGLQYFKLRKLLWENNKARKPCKLTETAIHFFEKISFASSAINP